MTSRACTALARLHSSLFALTILIGGCTDVSGERTVEAHNYDKFQSEVYPVLLRDCGFPACHGANDRAFRVYGPGRVRLPASDGERGAFDKVAGAEMRRTFQLASAHRNAENPDLSALIRKPLSSEAGGASHQGADKYGRDVYRTAQDEGYLRIARWIYSEVPMEAPSAEMED